MRRQHYGWWPYARYMIRRYPEFKERETLNDIEQNEHDAVKAAIAETERMHDSAKRMSVIERALIYCTHTSHGAAILVPCSDEAAKEWCSEFIELVAKKFFVRRVDLAKNCCIYTKHMIE